MQRDEVADFFLAVQAVGRLVERVYDASALNIAIQDGADAGQSVPHLHAHIIPRKQSDMDAHGGNDRIYEQLEGDDGDVGRHLDERERGSGRPKFPKVDEESRKPRTDEEMAAEAEMLRTGMEGLKL